MLSRTLPPLSAALLAGLLASCAVGPDYERPQSTASDEWLEPAVHGEVDGEWWASFEDPMLTRLIERAIAQAPDIRQATARLAEARALREAAQGGRLPQVNANGSATLNRLSENGQIPVGNIPGFDPEFPLLDAGFDASWEIDLWGRTSRQVEQARAREEAARWGRRDAMVTLTAEIARSYVEFRLAERQLQIADSALSAAEELSKLTALRFEAGEASRIEADQAASERAGRQAARDNADAQVAGAAYRLATLVGVPPEEIVPELLASSAPIPSPPDAIASGIRSELLERRPDIRSAERELAAATAGIGVATADLYPRFSLLGSIGLQAQSGDDFTDSGSLRYSAGPSFSWPIFSFGRIRAQIRAADARADGAAAAYEAAVMKALSESEAAANRFAASSAALRAHEAALERERSAFHLAEMRTQQGEASRLELEQARLRLANAERQAGEARAARASAAVALYKALGGGWQGAEGLARSD